MITKIISNNERAYTNGRDPSNLFEYRGLSTDTKPTDAPNGSVFFEMNTGKVFMYNATGSAWVEV